jgi:maltose alpha-D-glucosyltransferase/alpha-amylase
VPSLYYGDEIGQRYLPDLPDVEGSICHPTYNRAGCRTPMQWDTSANAGFSTAPADQLYLPVDPDPRRPDVATQRADEGSLLHLVRRLIALRRGTPALQPPATTEVLHVGYPFVYLRGGSHLVVVNPGAAPARATIADRRPARHLEVSGVSVEQGIVDCAGLGYGVFELG